MARRTQELLAHCSSMKYFGPEPGSLGSNTRTAGRPSTSPAPDANPRPWNNSEVSRNLGLAVHAGLADEVEAYIVRDHGADRVEIARVEVRDIGAEAIAIGVRQFRLRPILGLVASSPELRASAMEGCFYRGAG